MNINSWRPGLSASGASAIVGVRAYGFIDLEGAKVSAIIVEYGREILARSVDAGTFAISDYTIRQILLHGRESAIERTGKAAAGNEGGVVKVYVSDRPEPSQGGGEVLEANCGKVALVLHMEHAGANSAEPLASLASSRAAVRHAGEEVQAENPAIVVVPQIEEARRTTNDQMASSEANAAIWQLVDSVLALL